MEHTVVIDDWGLTPIYTTYSDPVHRFGEDAVDTIDAFASQVDPHLLLLMAGCLSIVLCCMLITAYCLGRVHENSAWERGCDD